MIIKLTSLDGSQLFLNKDKIVHFYFVTEILSYNKKQYTSVLLDNCSIQVKETCEHIYLLCNTQKNYD